MKAWQLIEKPESYDAINPQPHLGRCTHCLITAIVTANPTELERVYSHLGLKFGGSLVDWAKSHTHAEALALLKELDI